LNPIGKNRWLGGIIIGVGVLLLVSYFRSINRPAGESVSSTATESVLGEGELPGLDQLPADYVIQEGDSLWTISERVYGTGYNWVDIQAANKQMIPNANLLYVGTKIVLPKVDPKTVEHVTVAGDTLWGVAQRYCGSGFDWPALADANGITDPQKLEIGTVLTVVCK